MTYVLYRIYSESDELIYVGATTNPGRRFEEHGNKAGWWDEAAKITLQRLESAEELGEAELSAIAAEKPRHNVVGTDGPPTWARKKGKRKKGTGSICQRHQDGLWLAVIDLPSADGKRRQKRRYASTREGAEVALAELRTLRAECMRTGTTEAATT